MVMLGPISLGCLLILSATGLWWIIAKLRGAHLSTHGEVIRTLGQLATSSNPIDQTETGSGLEPSRSVICSNNWFDSIYPGLVPPAFHPECLTDEAAGEETAHDPAEEHRTFETVARRLESVLSNYKITATVVNYALGPVVVRYQVTLAPGCKVSRLMSLSRDLTRELQVAAVRVVEVVQGTACVGIEIPRASRQKVLLKTLLCSKAFVTAEGPLNVVLGVDVVGTPVILNLAQLPHLLVAGTTGSGKSVGLNSILVSLLCKASPQEVRLILMDPKRLELSLYQGSAHVLGRVATSLEALMAQLTWCVDEMERRYRLLCAFGVKSIADYNERLKSGTLADAKERLDREEGLPAYEHLHPYPYLVVVIDEFSDLLLSSGKEAETLLVRLSQKGRSAGIHLILATQRPSVDIITGTLKANIPARISFVVASKFDSRTILDQSGAENLLGKGDMLYVPADTTLTQRIHGAWISDADIMKVVHHTRATVSDKPAKPFETGTHTKKEASLSRQRMDRISKEPSGEDALYARVCEWIIRTQQPSISAIQREFRVGYNRAARMMEHLERNKLVSKPKSGNSRKVLKKP